MVHHPLNSSISIQCRLYTTKPPLNRLTECYPNSGGLDDDDEVEDDGEWGRSGGDDDDRCPSAAVLMDILTLSHLVHPIITIYPFSHSNCPSSQ